MADLGDIYARREKLRRQHNTPGYGLSPIDPDWLAGPFAAEQADITAEELAERAKLTAATPTEIGYIGATNISFPSAVYKDKVTLVRKLLNVDSLTDDQQKVVADEWNKLKFDPPEAELNKVTFVNDVIKT